MKNKINKIKTKVKNVKKAKDDATSVTPTPTPTPTHSPLFCREDRNDCPPGMTCVDGTCV